MFVGHRNEPKVFFWGDGASSKEKKLFQKSVGEPSWACPSGKEALRGVKLAEKMEEFPVGISEETAGEESGRKGRN